MWSNMRPSHLPQFCFFLRPPGATSLPALGRAARVTRVCRGYIYLRPAASRRRRAACLRGGRPREARARCRIEWFLLYIIDLQFSAISRRHRAARLCGWLPSETRAFRSFIILNTKNL